MSILVCGPKSWWFCKSLSQSLGLNGIEAESKRFPDGELYVRLPVDTRGEDVIIAQSMPPNQTESLWELLLMVDAAVNMRSRRITVFAPYIAYSRQDRVFLEGEPISIKVLLQSLSLAGASRLVTIDIHKPASLSYFRGTARNVIPAKTFCELLKRTVGEAIVIAPDKGAIDRANMVGRECGWRTDYLEKTRDRITGEISMKPKKLNVRGENIVIFDDIISSGGTVSRAAEILYEDGAETVYVAAAHALMTDGAIHRITRSGVKKIIAANTLPPKEGVEYIDVSREASEHLE